MSVTGTEGEIVAGVVGRPWGLRGQFHLAASLEDPTVLLPPTTLRLRRKGAPPVACAILATHRAGGRLIVTLEGCGSIEQAEALRGAELLLESGALAPAPEGSFYPHQLQGLRVVGIDGTAYGCVKTVVQTGGPELLVVRTEAKEILIPFVEAICRRVDTAAGVIEIDPPEGLMDLD